MALSKVGTIKTISITSSMIMDTKSLDENHPKNLVFSPLMKTKDSLCWLVQSFFVERLTGFTCGPVFAESLDHYGSGTGGEQIAVTLITITAGVGLTTPMVHLSTPSGPFSKADNSVTRGLSAPKFCRQPPPVTLKPAGQLAVIWSNDPIPMATELVTGTELSCQPSFARNHH